MGTIDRDLLPKEENAVIEETKAAQTVSTESTENISE